MNLAEAAIRNKTVTLVFTTLMVVLGVWSYLNLPRLEDPEFTIKDALIVTDYPGASAQEVADEVTDVLERAVQQLGQLERVESRSERGRSIVTATIKDRYDRNTLPQVWDELRRKVADAQSQLPPGAGPSRVLDDFGDVFGIFYALIGDDYSDAQLTEVAKMLRRNLILVRDVKKVEIFASQQEIVYVEMDRDRMARLGVRPEEIFSLLREQNLVVSAGSLDVGPLRLSLDPTGAITNVDQLGDILIRHSGDQSQPLVYLRDIATIWRGYAEPPTTLLRYDGKPAVGLGISTVSGGNVVTMGEAVQRRLDELRSEIPLGVELHTISFQADNVTEAIRDFVTNLVQAVVIVFVVLLIFMGLRSGLIIGVILLVTICATMIVMDLLQLPLERISLGALIIALAMLIDNAIVITEGMLIAIERGTDRLKAAREVVSQTAIPLLGSTAIAILAFGAIGLSQDSTGEYCRSLFVVLLISLTISWVTAVTTTPLLGYLFLKKSAQGAQARSSDPYAGVFYSSYKRLLLFCLKFRWLTLGVLVGLLVLAGFGFRFVEQSFFPDSTRRQLLVDIWMPEGTRADELDRTTAQMAKFIRAVPGVTHLTTVVGRGALRFLLTYSPEQANSSFAQFIIDVSDQRLLDSIQPRVQQELSEGFPDSLIITKRFLLGPGSGGRIQVRFAGPDHNELRRLAAQAMTILREDGTAKGVRIDSREQIPIVRPQFAEVQARQAGITRTDLGAALQSAFSGRRIGVYREGDELIPIVARAPQSERSDPDFLHDLQIFSPVAGGFIPMRQLVSGFAIDLENPFIMRRDGQETITVHADPATGLAGTLFDRVRAKIEAIPLPPGYSMQWGGEHEDSSKAQAALAGTLPAFVLLMVLICVWLFNSLRITLIIWLIVPLSLIGIVLGLLLFGKPFGFMALLGALSLSGMLIKNAIVLIEEINLLLASGKPPWDAVLEASVSRVRPVSMAALTTVFGLIPLLFDVFFGAMAVTIIVGLLFATILTLIVVPLLYVVFFRFHPSE